MIMRYHYQEVRQWDVQMHRAAWRHLPPYEFPFTEQNMSKYCYLTGKKNMVVNRVTRRGKARAAGGVGRKTTGVSKRTQKANLQKRQVREGGAVKTVWLSCNAIRTLERGTVRDLVLL